MKYKLALSFVLFAYISYSQDYCLCRDKLYINVGLNIVDSSGEHNPFDILSDSNKLIFKNPLKLGINYNFSEKFELHLNVSTNTYKVGQIIDGITLDEKLNYLSTDVGIKYYLYDFNISKYKTLRFYTTSGLGFFQLKNQTTASFNIGGGLQYWFNRDWGLSVNSLGKFSLDQKPIYSNHFQHSFGILFSIFN